MTVPALHTNFARRAVLSLPATKHSASHSVPTGTIPVVVFTEASTKHLSRSTHFEWHENDSPVFKSIGVGPVVCSAQGVHVANAGHAGNESVGKGKEKEKKIEGGCERVRCR